MKKQIEKNYEKLKNKITIISIDEKKLVKINFSLFLGIITQEQLFILQKVEIWKQ